MSERVLVMPGLDERDREERRYGLYVVTANGQSEIAATPTLEGIGPMIAHLREEGQIAPDSQIGIHDKVGRTWLLSPYARGA